MKNELKASCGVIVWFLIGMYGFCFWQTKKFDITCSDVPIVILMGALGPVTWPLGWVIMGDPIFKSDKIILHRRNQEQK